jgi:2-polyprenyl-3-methyl-5-hydroxy-6-metoxy-1,4-benzoquinol methylase
MDPNDFVAEVYRRMALRHHVEQPKPTFAEIERDARVLRAIAEYESLLPTNKDASILDIGFGDGWFIAACLKLGYGRISGADFSTSNKAHVGDWASGGSVTLYEIKKDIGSFLSERAEEYDFIHMSHVIEHIPKYSLLWIVDAIFRALKIGGVLLVRTPNMEGPTANSCLYVTLSHEYGFAGANLISLLDICGFDDIKFHKTSGGRSTLKQRLGSLLRWPYLANNRVRHRLFGVNEGGEFGTELVVTARRGEMKPFFDPKYK